LVRPADYPLGDKGRYGYEKEKKEGKFNVHWQQKPIKPIK